jgi:23S rRNA (uridine2552-2'-O)-methyltransferase
MAKRSKSSQRWLDRQRRDYYAREAKDKGQVSRAHFKLAQLDRRFRLVRGDCRVLELGAAPGGWTNYLEAKVSKGLLIAVDPLPITAGAETCVIEGMAGDADVVQRIDDLTQDAPLDLVLSDMAPNISGVRAVDQARAMDLADCALDACNRWLRKGGALVIKAFQGEGFDAWVAALKGCFATVKVTKPKASRDESREVFVVAEGFRGAGAAPAHERDDVGSLV